MNHRAGPMAELISIHARTRRTKCEAFSFGIASLIAWPKVSTLFLRLRVSGHTSHLPDGWGTVRSSGSQSRYAFAAVSKLDDDIHDHGAVRRGRHLAMLKVAPCRSSSERPGSPCFVPVASCTRTTSGPDRILLDHRHIAILHRLETAHQSSYSPRASRSRGSRRDCLRAQGRLQTVQSSKMNIMLYTGRPHLSTLLIASKPGTTALP